VWADLRRFIANPGEVLERVREQLDTGDNTEELEARRAELVKRLTARHAEKDRYVRLYAQRHLSKEELDAYLADLKNQTENIRLLLESVEDEMSHGRDQAELTETAYAWLLALRQRIAEVEENTQGAFRVRRQLTRLLVAGVTVGKTHEGGTEVRITYRFGPPPGEDCSEDSGEEDYSVVASFKNGSIS
jgi:chromosome segregation ATPase